jgi:hypothetical protein
MSKGWMRAYVVQKQPLRKLAKESQTGMYFTLFVFITFACSFIIYVTKYQIDLSENILSNINYTMSFETKSNTTIYLSDLWWTNILKLFKILLIIYVYG